MWRSPLATASGPSTSRERANSGDGDDETGPDRHRETGRGADPAGDDVARGPGQGAGEAEHQREQRGLGGAPQRDHGETDQPDEDAELLALGRALVEGECRDDDGEDDLHLDDERGQARGHPEVQRQVEQAELSQAEEQADEQDVAPASVRALHEEDGRHQHGHEAQRDEGQRRHVVQAGVDDDEVRAPDDRDRDGGEGVARRHGPMLAPTTVKYQRIMMHLTM